MILRYVAPNPKSPLYSNSQMIIYILIALQIEYGRIYNNVAMVFD